MIRARWRSIGVHAAVCIALIVVFTPYPVSAADADPRDIALRQLAFEPAEGAADTFVARTAHGALAVSPGSIRVTRGDATPVTIAFPGALRRPLQPLAPRPGRVNYIRGVDPASWRVNLPTYARLRASDVYRGISVEYYGTTNQLEYDFIVTPGADARAIRIAIDSDERVDVGNDGALRLRGGTIVQRRPEAYQVVDGARRTVGARYVRDGDRRFRIALDDYDRGLELIIDPIVVVDVTVGGSLDDAPFDIAGGSLGTYVAGDTGATNAPLCNPNGEGFAPHPCRDGFVMRVNPLGVIESRTHFGGGNDDTITNVAVDPMGFIYVAGNSASSGFIPGEPACGSGAASSPFTQGAPITRCGFVAKLTPNGSSLVYLVRMPTLSPRVSPAADGSLYVLAQAQLLRFATGGGAPVVLHTFAADDVPSALAAGVADDVFVAGGHKPPLPDVVYDVFVERFDADGVTLSRAALAGAASDQATSVTVGDDGTAWIAGTTASANFPFTVPSPSSALPGRVFLAHLAADGTTFDVVRSSGSPGEFVSGARVRTSQAVFVAGCFTASGTTSCETARYDFAGNPLGTKSAPTSVFTIAVPPPSCCSTPADVQWFAAPQGSTPAGDVRLVAQAWLINPFVNTTASSVRFGIPFGMSASTFISPYSDFGRPLEYTFWRHDAPAGWTQVQPYGRNGFYQWTPAYADIGEHEVQVWIRPVGSIDPYEVWASANVSVTAGALPVITGLTTNTSSPAGVPLTWTATATAGAAAPQYQFWRMDADGWHVVQDYSASNSYIWTPTAADQGAHSLQVWVRNADSPAAYEAYRATTVTVLAPQPLVVTSLTASTAPTVSYATTWTATTGGGAAPLRFKFLRRDNGVWATVQDYGPSNTYTWTPSPGEVGDHAVQVWVRNSGSLTPLDAWLGTSFTIAAPAPLQVTAGPTTAIPVAGRPLTFAATTTGGIGPFQYRFLRFDQTTGWAIVQDYGASNTYTWNTTVADAGAHAVQVWVRNAGSSAALDAWTSTGDFVVPPLTVRLTSVPGTLAPGQPISLTAAASDPGVEYMFWVSIQGGWQPVQLYGPSASASYTPNGPGDYAFQVWVRRVGSSANYEAWAGSDLLHVR